jgi:hypothetical protein
LVGTAGTGELTFDHSKIVLDVHSNESALVDQAFALQVTPGSQNMATEKNMLDLCPALRYAENSHPWRLSRRNHA